MTDATGDLGSPAVEASAGTSGEPAALAAWWAPCLATLGARAGRHGPIARGLITEAIAHLEQVLSTKPFGTVGGMAVSAAVHESLAGRPPPSSLQAAAAATFLALDLIDDQMDGDPPGFWRSADPGAAGLGCHLLLAIARAEAADIRLPQGEIRAGDVFDEMFADVVEGQLMGERSLTVETTPGDVEDGIRRRSGAMLAGFARLAALAAGASAEQIAAATAFGAHCGIARQHLNDVTELVSGRRTDLRNGTATMPIAFALQGLSDERDRHDLLARVRAAADDDAGHARLLAALAPEIAQTCLLAHLHLAQARDRIPYLRSPGVRQDGLHRLVDEAAAAMPGNRRGMTTSDDGQAALAQVREKFIADPEFRAEVRADPAAALEKALGRPLSDGESAQVAALASSSDDDVIESLRSGQVGSW